MHLQSLFLAGLATACVTSAQSSVASVHGEGAIVHERLVSDIFGNERFLRVWLPPGYNAPENASRVYPVLYMNDGQNLFQAETSFNGMEWGLDEIVERLVREKRIPPIIVVGIDNGGRAGRAREYLPYPDTFLTPPEPDPQGALYDEFLEREVFPLVEARFRVGRSRESRTLGGSSYGALVTVHVLVSKPSLVSAALLESPSFYVDNEHVLRDAGTARIELDRVYLGIGTNELNRPDCAPDPGNAEAVDGVAKMAAILRSAGLTESSRRLMVAVEECAVHNELAWAKRLEPALLFLFGSS